MKFEPQFSKDSVAYNTIKIDSILNARLVDFPKVNPAIKRGIPVKTQFILPVILKVEVLSFQLSLLSRSIHFARISALSGLGM
jgi:hypothetical protein